MAVMKKVKIKKFYNLRQEKDILLFAEVEKGYELNFRREKIYDVPLEYPHHFKMINGDFSDYVAGYCTPNIISEKLKNLIEQFEKTKIEWVHVKVENKDGSLHDGYFPRFVPVPHMFDVLHEDTLLTKHGDIMIPKLSASKTKDRHFIRVLENSAYTYVSEDLKKAMQEANITGIASYSKVKMYP
jgi:nicotinamidase-related amidase